MFEHICNWDNFLWMWLFVLPYYFSFVGDKEIEDLKIQSSQREQSYHDEKQKMTSLIEEKGMRLVSLEGSFRYVSDGQHCVVY